MKSAVEVLEGYRASLESLLREFLLEHSGIEPLDKSEPYVIVIGRNSSRRWLTSPDSPCGRGTQPEITLEHGTSSRGSGAEPLRPADDAIGPALATMRWTPVPVDPGPHGRQRPPGHRIRPAAAHEPHARVAESAPGERDAVAL
jgi:hypothetical protein